MPVLVVVNVPARILVRAHPAGTAVGLAASVFHRRRHSGESRSVAVAISASAHELSQREQLRIGACFGRRRRL